MGATRYGKNPKVCPSCASPICEADRAQALRLPAQFLAEINAHDEFEDDDALRFVTAEVPPLGYRPTDLASPPKWLCTRMLRLSKKPFRKLNSSSLAETSNKADIEDTPTKPASKSGADSGARVFNPTEPSTKKPR